MRTVLGIDGGGTKTRAVIIAHDGRVLGRGEAGSSNYHSVGLDTAFANILEAEGLARARSSLGAEHRHAAACLGLAGCGTEADRAKLAPIASKLPVSSPRLVRIESDMRIAHAGAFEDEPGLILIAGTGSVCYGIDAAGKEARAGGWGPMFDDWGSAFDMGRRAITLTLRAADGRHEGGLLTQRVAAQFNGDLRAMATLSATGDDRNRVANLAPLVFQADDDHDTSAGAIIMMAAEELAVCVEAVAKKLRFEHEIELVLFGGLCEAGRTFFQTLYSAIRRRLPQVNIVSDMLPAVMGAALLALKMIDVNVRIDVLSAMKKDLGRPA